MVTGESQRLLADRYRLCAIIGRGGMGAVWRARDEMLNRDVAVKEIVWPPQMDQAEREIARRLRHPNVVGVYDIVEEDENSPSAGWCCPARTAASGGSTTPSAGTNAAQRFRRFRRFRVGWAALTAVAAIAVITAGIAMVFSRPPGHQAAQGTSSRASGRASESSSARAAPAPSSLSTPASAPSPSSTTTPGSSGSNTLPAGYYWFTNPTGFSIGVPRGWQISHVGHYVYIVDPVNSGIFLLIDQSDQPKPNPLADWQQQAANRQGTYPDYHLILLRAVHYTQAEKAADWEFTYNRNGVMVQVLNRNILANAQHAYALYWSTPVSDWNAYYHFFQVFAATFRPAGTS
jgi:hypothetical protein